MKSGVVSGEGIRLAADLLRALVRVDTSVAGAGGEAQAARILAEFLTHRGITTHIHAAPDGRVGVIARLPATREVRAAEEQVPPGPLVVSTHLDCHPFDREGWLHDPLGGETTDGAIWGRGTVNCKGPIAVWAALMAAAAQSSRPRVRDLVLVATSGGVGGGACGLGWLYGHQGGPLAADAVISQGGGWPMRLCGKTYYTFNFAERGTAVATIRRHPGAVRAQPLPIHISPHFISFVDSLAGSQPRPAASIIRAMLSPTLTEPAVCRLVNSAAERAMLLAGARNQIARVRTAGNDGTAADSTTAPAAAGPDGREVTLDCLFLPGTGCEELAVELAETLGIGRKPGAGDGSCGGEIDVEIKLRASVSPAHHELIGAVAKAVARHARGAGLVPLVSPGPTSCRVPRELGLPAYGFFPMLDGSTAADPRAPNERLSLAGLAFALAVLRDVLDGYVGGPRAATKAAAPA